MGVLRGRPGDLSLMLSYITKLVRLRTMTHRPVGPTGLYIHYASLSIGYPLTPSFGGFIRAGVFFWINILLLLF
jgi:hypothetical protein